MTEQLTPELKASFEAIARRYETGKIGFRQALEEAHNMDKWVDVKTPPEKDGNYNVAFSNMVIGSCYYSLKSGWVYDNRYPVTHYQPLPAAPLPSHTITKEEEK